MARRKPNRNRKQQEADETLVDLVEAKDFMERNQNTIFGVLVAAVVLIGGYFAYSNLVVAPKQDAAISEMWDAENKFAQDSFQTAITQSNGFAEIIDNYGSTDAANVANYNMAVSYLNLGKYDNAIKRLNSVSAGGEVLPIMKNGLLGDAYSEKQEFDKALSFYKKAANAENNDILSPYYLKKYGLLSLKQGDTASAKTAFERIKKEYPNSPDGRDIDKYLVRVSG